MSERRSKLPPVVLVLEDEPIQRMMLVDLVEKAGFEALEVADADEAVRILEERLDIHVVVADIYMPSGVNGLKLAETIRDRWPPIEIIVTSGRRVLQVDDLPEHGLLFPRPYQQTLVVEAIRRLAA